MLKIQEIIVNQIIIALIIWGIWELAYATDASSASSNASTLVFAWIITGIIGCFKEF
jgi:hypothetical protein